MTVRPRDYHQEATLRRLQTMVPAECPLIVQRRARELGGFEVLALDGSDGCGGRFEVVAAWIRGYLTAWRAQV